MLVMETKPSGGEMVCIENSMKRFVFSAVDLSSNSIVNNEMLFCFNELVAAESVATTEVIQDHSDSQKAVSNELAIDEKLNNQITVQEEGSADETDKIRSVACSAGIEAGDNGLSNTLLWIEGRKKFLLGCFRLKTEKER